MVLPTTKCQAKKNGGTSSGARPHRAPGQVQGQIDAEDDNDEPDSSTHSSASLFGELEAVRGSSWQYEFQ